MGSMRGNLQGEQDFGLHILYPERDLERAKHKDQDVHCFAYFRYMGVFVSEFKT